MILEQPIRMKNNGQINIVFNAEKRKAIQKDLPIKEIYEREHIPAACGIEGN